MSHLTNTLCCGLLLGASMYGQGKGYSVSGQPQPEVPAKKAEKKIDVPVDKIGFSAVLELKTGEKLEGAFVQATSEGAVITVGGQSINIPLAKLRTIYIGEPAPLKVEPRATSEPRASSSNEALDVLRALGSVTTSGVTYREYSPRVLDARIAVDRYLAGSKDGQERDSIAAAMRYYEMASQAWGLMFSRGRNDYAASGAAASSPTDSFNSAIRERIPLRKHHRCDFPAFGAAMHKVADRNPFQF